MARVVLIKHDDDPCDDRVSAWFAAKGLDCDWRYPYRGDPLGRVGGDVEATVLYGGPQSIPDVHEHPHLVREAAWVLECERRGVPVLGFCQGAQVIAYALGAPSGPLDDGRCEFGYYPLRVAPAGAAVIPDGLVVCQSHFHQFEVPAGAELLASSDAFTNQAFRYGEHVWAFQFHPEITVTGFRRWQDIHWAPYHRPGAQRRDEQDALMVRHDPIQHEWMTGFLTEFVGPQMPSLGALSLTTSR
ncbi:MAG: type 1 glutamine amidotransferase [Ilumatobacteraceae bacterium]